MKILKTLLVPKEMLLTHRFIPLTRFINFRLYGKKSIKSNKMSDILPENPPRKPCHQDVFRYIYPFAHIKVRSDVKVRVLGAPADKYPEPNVLNAMLIGGHVRNCPVTMHVDVSEDEKLVNIALKKISDSADFYCDLEVPMRCDLHIDAKDSVTVRNICSSEITVRAQKNIKTKDLQADNVTLASNSGDITCESLLRGRLTIVETNALGNISLDKLLGINLNCKTEAGNISTNSCYVEESKFVTLTGSLQLKNVHKKIEVDVQRNGELTMTGVNGNLTVRTNGGKLSLQISELTGNSVINAKEVEQALINISEQIEEQSNIEVTSRAVVLDDSLSHLQSCITDDNTIFLLKPENTSSNLIVNSNGKVQLGKLSWIGSVYAQLNKSDTK
uniref:Protein FAM185A n=1 Tax=Ceratitis capitata TaxID=7213 RepID=W8B723_CERCA